MTGVGSTPSSPSTGQDSVFHVAALEHHPVLELGGTVDARIQLSPPHLGPLERQFLLDAFESNWIAPVGPDIDAFERELADSVQMRRGVALSSGTAGIHLALQVLGVGPGDAVLVPSYTFVATANAVTYLGARPVFVDSTAETWTVDPALVATELQQRARQCKLPAAVISVDLYGQCADYDPLLEVCERYGVPLVEDAAEALGAWYKGRPAGTFGAAGVFSFNGNKIITTSGGGMVVIDDDALADRIRHLATQAREPVPHYEHREVGYNYRLSNLLAAIGRGQLRALPERVKQRQDNNSYYRKALAGLPGVEFMPVAPYGEPNFWLTCILIEPSVFGATREDVRVHLESRNIESRPTWKPMHLQPAFAGCEAVGGGVCDDLFRRGLCLPSGSSLIDLDRHRVAAAIHSVPRYGRHR